jgi:hypothetical protein
MYSVIKTTDQELVVCEGEEVAKDDRTPNAGQHWQHSEVAKKGLSQQKRKYD